MDEREWLACSDPGEMLALIWERSTERKIQLFNCACCRRIWHLFYDERSRSAIEAAERYNAGLLSAGALARATARAGKALNGPKPLGACLRTSAAGAAYSACCEHDWVRIQRYGPRVAAYYAALAAAGTADAGFPPAALSHRAKAFERAGQAVLLRDIIGNPFRSTDVDRSWQTPTVLILARAAYDERFMPSGNLDTARLAVLADALEEAGCDRSELLEHLRGAGAHVQGCWVLDLIRGAK